MPSHSLILEVPRQGDHLISRGRQVLISGSQSQRRGVDQQVYRIGKGQGGLSRVSLVAHLNANGGRHQSGVPVSADRMERRLLSEVSGAGKPVGRASRDVAHGSLLSESIEHGNCQPFGFRGSVGDAAQHFQGQDQAGDQALFVGALSRPVFGSDRLPAVLTHAHGSAVVRCGHFATEGR